MPELYRCGADMGIWQVTWHWWEQLREPRKELRAMDTGIPIHEYSYGNCMRYDSDHPFASKC